jgi:hypothetical protein
VGQRWINGGQIGNGGSGVVWECEAERLAGTRSEGELLIWRVNVDMVFLLLRNAMWCERGC